MTLNGTTYDDTAVVNEGDRLALKVQYSREAAGQEVTLDISGAVDFPESIDLSGNTAIEAYSQEGNSLTITFAPDEEWNVNQGVLTLEMIVNNVDESGQDQITWAIDGAEESTEVIVRNEGDSFADVSDSSAKSVSAADLNSYVSVDESGTVTIDPTIAEEPLSYTLQLNSAQARNGFAISDVLPEGLSYVDDSFSGEITTWDESGLNQATSDFPFTPAVEGNEFSASVDVPGAESRDPEGPSKLTITYQATVTDVDALQSALQDEYDALAGSEDPYGNYSIALENTATFGDDTRTAVVRIGGNIETPPAPPGPEPGNTFAKDASWQDRTVESTAVADDDTLSPALDITYTLTANLANLQGDSDFELGQDVIITDTLPAQAQWNTEADDFITATGLSLDQVTDCTGFAASSSAGDWCVDGQSLLVNVGQDTATDAAVEAKAQITTIEDLAEGGGSSVEGSQTYQIRNEAAFNYGGDNPYTSGYDSFITVLPDAGDSGYHDTQAFSKAGPDENITVSPGDTLTVPYTFTVAEGTDYDVTQSRIVDYIDPELFDLSDLSAVDISGTYDWWRELGPEEFVLSQDAEQNLVIELSESGEEVVAEAENTNRQLSVTIELTTTPFDGKETKTLTNKATLFGGDDDPLYWDSATTESTSYGDEAEVRKRVYDRNTDEGLNPWVETLPAATDADGHLINDTYVYRVEFIPHGQYDGIVIADVTDVLPEAVDFLGFVDEADAATAADPSMEPRELNGNILAVYDEQAGTVTLTQEEGTVLDAGEPIAAYFAVEITDDSAPIVNSIGNTSTTIVPQDPPSIDVEKWTDEGDDAGPAYDQTGALTNDGYPGDFDEGPSEDTEGHPGKALDAGNDQRIEFTISNDGSETLTDIEVTDELTAGENSVQDLVCTFPDETTGTTWAGPFEPATQFECTGTLPGLAAGQTHSDTATVTGVGIDSQTEVTDSDDWHAFTKTYAVGDYTWIDSNRDGVQDPDEDVLPGVTVELLDEAGDVVATTTTDEEGYYLFDNLPAGDYQVRFTLTEEQAEQYRFTQADAGADDATDSDADPATGLTEVFALDDSNQALTSDENYDQAELTATQGIDPTWDAGVNLKQVSVGDYVWVDSNRDGIQDEGEPGIPGVTLCLVGPDGEPVTDVFGDPVEPVVTDENGHYTFENLPALQGEQTYTVCIDQDASAEALEPYVPTTANAGADTGVDSDTWEAQTTPGDLHDDGDRDPSLDFGFVTKSYAVGDFTWIDSNKDGVQDPDEDVLPGVGVELLNEAGDVVATTTTDAQGRYLFDDLEAGTYQVRFTLTEDQAEQYQFTQADAGQDDGADSDADPATGLTAQFVLDDSNTALTSDYDREFTATQGIDPTWDAGVNLLPTTASPTDPDDADEPADPAAPADPGESADTAQQEVAGGFLPDTGTTIGAGVIVAILALLGSGGALLAIRRRRSLS